MKEKLHWSRRQFVQGAGLSSIGLMTLGVPSLIGTNRKKTSAPPRFAYVGFSGEGANDQGIAVFDARAARWKQTSTVSSRTPSSLALDAKERFLYAVNEIDEHEGLPAGTVEAYAIDQASGELTLLNRQRLSLSATFPRHAAVSPDGRALVVAVHGGGAYNVLPISEDGSLGAVTGILKETGSGPHEGQDSAHPQMVVFDRAGRVVSTDLGSDRLSVLQLNGASISVARRYAVRTGEGPRHIALHPNGKFLFVANGLEGSLVCYGYDPMTGRITERLSEVAADLHSGVAAMAMDPEGELLVAAHESPRGSISAWKIIRSSGQLLRLRVENSEGLQLHQIAITSDGESLLGVSRAQGVYGWQLREARFGRPERLADLSAPISIAVKSL